jgi:hypothetical protein
MKRLLRIFELTKNERRVVLIVMLVLITVTFVSYERRVHRPSVQATAALQARPSASPSEMEDER